MNTTLRVHRHILHSRAAAGSSPPSSDAVAAALAEAVRAIEPLDRGGVWLVRRLDVRAATAAGSSPRDAAARLASALVRALDVTLAAGAQGEDVRWFVDRAALLEQWLADLVSDRADGQWQYRSFTASDRSIAVRTRAEAEPDDLARALRRLPASDLDDLVALLAPPDAAAVVLALAQDRDGGARGEVISVVRRLLDAGRLPSDPRRATLLAVLSLDDRPTPTEAAYARDVVLVALALRTGRWTEREERADAMIVGDWASVDPAVAAALSGWTASERADLIETLTATTDDRAQPDRTVYGGLFLLLPLLAELPLAAATQGWPDLDGTSARSALAALVVLAVMGSDRSVGVLADPWFQLALGLPSLDLAELARWTDDVGETRLATLPAAFDDVLRRRPGPVAEADLLLAGLAQPAAGMIGVAADALLRELSYRLPGMAQASAAHLRRNVLALDAIVTREPDRFVVELGHPPLNLLLSLTGMNRRTFYLPATGGRPWILTSAP